MVPRCVDLASRKAWSRRMETMACLPSANSARPGRSAKRRRRRAKEGQQQVPACGLCCSCCFSWSLHSCMTSCSGYWAAVDGNQATHPYVASWRCLLCLGVCHVGGHRAGREGSRARRAAMDARANHTSRMSWTRCRYGHGRKRSRSTSNGSLPILGEESLLLVFTSNPWCDRMIVPWHRTSVVQSAGRVE